MRKALIAAACGALTLVSVSASDKRACSDKQIAELAVQQKLLERRYSGSYAPTGYGIKNVLDFARAVQGACK